VKRRILASQVIVRPTRPRLALVPVPDSRLPLPQVRRRDSAKVGGAIAVSLLVGAVLVAMAMGWVRL
jgi:hypothetical protein